MVQVPRCLWKWRPPRHDGRRFRARLWIDGHRPSVLSSPTSHCGPPKPSPLPLSQPLEGFLLKIGRWRSAAAPAVDLPSSRGSACLQRAHSTARGNSRIAGWTRSVVCGFVSESFGLDSAALVMVGRSQHVCVGRCRPFGREGSAHSAGALGGLARTMVRAWVVVLLKFICRAAAWRQLFLAEPMGPGQVGGVSQPVSLGVESRAAALTVALRQRLPLDLLGVDLLFCMCKALRQTLLLGCSGLHNPGWYRCGKDAWA